MQQQTLPVLKPPAQRFQYFKGTDARNRPIPRRELFDEEAEDVARRFSAIHSSQLRRFYGAVTSLKRQIELDHDAFPDETLRARLALLKAHAAYAQKRVKDMPQDFVAFFTRHADAVQTKGDFLYGFAPHFEAVIAYHKIYEKDDKGGTDMAATLTSAGRVRIEGEIRLLSGLHIGAGKDTIEIGGIDNPVVKHPHTREPYIPGSSVKGKLRYLLEWAFQPVFGSIRQDGKPWGADDKQTYRTDDPVLRIFGTSAKRETWSEGPTRLIVRDAHLRKDYVDEVLTRGEELTEAKTEVVIDRIAGKAHDKVGPRQTERVPAGAVFDLEMVFRLYDTGDGGMRDRECLNWLLAGLHLLEQDALGGSGSRGYGRVRFEGLRISGDGIDDQEIGERFRVNRFDPTAAPTIVAFAR